jgi:hypothetical protein
MNLGRLVQKLFLGAAIAVAPLLNGCEKATDDEGESPPAEYVTPGNADVRGTWYNHGIHPGGWYGPEHAWDFGWYYIKQYGTNVEATYERELYKEFKQYRGGIESNTMFLSYVSTNGQIGVAVEYTIEGETFMRPHHIFRPTLVERTSHEIESRRTPWN